MYGNPAVQRHVYLPCPAGRVPACRRRRCCSRVALWYPCSWPQVPLLLSSTAFQAAAAPHATPRSAHSCAAGQVKQLERWLARGGNPCALDRQGGRGTLLHAAARGDQAECIKVRAYLDASAAVCLQQHLGCLKGNQAVCVNARACYLSLHPCYVLCTDRLATDAGRRAKRKTGTPAKCVSTALRHLLHASSVVASLTRGCPTPVLQALVKAGADVNAVTKLRGSPLHAAAQHGTGHAVAALLKRCGAVCVGVHATGSQNGTVG